MFNYRYEWLLSMIAIACCTVPVSMLESGRPGGEIILTLPRAPVVNEGLLVQVRTGLLPSGSSIRVVTAGGILLGTIAPFGLSGREGGVYTVPIPRELVVDTSVRLRLELVIPGSAVRAPGSDEVESIHLVFVPISN